MNPQLMPRHAAGESDACRTVVRFVGSKVCLDEHTVDCVRHQLLDLADAPGALELILDFSNVQFVASLALGTLITMHKRLTAAGRLLTLCNLCPFVREVIATACLDRLLNVQPEEWQLDPAPPDFSVHVPPGLLVVDSDGEALQALGVALRAKGFRVWLASRGVQAVQVFCRNRQDIGLVLLDALMPRLDGPDTLAAMRRISSAVRCCFTISRSNASTESLLLRFGAVRVLRKPIAVAEVEEMLGQPASRSSQRGEVRWIEIPRQGD